MKRLLNSLHVRLAFVLLLSVLPPFAALWSTAAHWREHESVEAEENGLRLARHASSVYARLVTESAHPDRWGSIRETTMVAAALEPEADPALRSAWLTELLMEARFPPGTTMTVFDRAGSLLTLEFDGSLWRERPPQREEALVRLAGAGPEGMGTAVSSDGVVRLFGVTAVRTGSRERFVAVGVPRSAAASEIDMAHTRLVQGLAVSLLVAAVVMPFGLRWSVTAPLASFSHAITRVSAGELGARTGLEAGPTEIARLATAFDEMTTTIERRNREVALQTQRLSAQERRFRALIENATDGVVLIDAAGIMRYASPSTARLLGYAPEELVGLAAFTHGHPEERAGHRSRFEELARTPGGSVGGCFRLQHKDGSWRWMESIATNLLHDPDVGAIVANYRDVTARFEAQEQLRQAHDDLERRVEMRTTDLLAANEALQAEIAERAVVERHLLKLWHAVEQTTDALLVTDSEGTIEYVNPAFERITGYSAKEAVGRTPGIVRSGQHERGFYERLWRTIKAGQVFRSVFVNRTKSGELYYEDRTIAPVRDTDGRITHFVSTGRDITKARRTEEALRRMNQRLENETTRIAGVLHDEAGQFLTAAHITLAAVLRELPAALRDGLLTVRDHLDEVEGRLRRLSHELHPRVLDDLGLIEALRFLAAGVSKRTGLEVTVDAPTDDSCCPAARTAIYRLVQEALTNVARHARAKQVDVVLSRDDGFVRCTVQDDGVGFDVTGAGRSGKASLGLQGIRDRLEAVNGVLDVVSAPGRGTKVCAVVPLES